MAPVDQTRDSSLVDTGGFELIRNTLAFNKFPVFEYQSKRTGLTVIIAEIEGPILNGYFALATEAFDDDGLPHTLEHLIFLGSDEYPYKGVLDLLANRCLASGTNAWTDTDHTCYTMDTAGSDGFLALMPIYLDHILFPVLTESSFVTEVHHITEKGDDAGVVYCEMQGRESSANSRLFLAIARAMYPGHCGYSSETGGIMKNLRESTDNAKVRNYHKEFYRPENLKIIVTGIVNHADVFKQLEHVEQKLVNKGETTPFQRPWQSPVPPLPESRDLLVDYPADEEDNGMYCIAWRGPSAVTDQYNMAAMTIFLKYLTDFSTYTLPKEFVEIDDPYASSICYNLFENSESCHCILFEDVPLEKLHEIKPKLLDLFKKVAAEEDINMERMHSIIKRNQLELLSNTENCPNSTLSFLIIGFILYGNTKDDLEQRLNPLSDLDQLLHEPKSFWLNLFKKYFVEGNYVSVECRPSKNEHKKMDQEEAERIEKQIKELGPAGLKEKGEILTNAIAFNTREPPIEMLTSVPIPSLASINFHNIERYRSDSEDKSKIDLSRTSVFTCFDHLKSEFVYMYAFLDSSRLPSEDRIYLPLILQALFESAIDKNGTIIPYEEVVEQINLDTVSFSTTIGVSSGGSLYSTGSYCQTLGVLLQVESKKYAKGLEWLRDVVYNTVFAADRLKIIATKMNNAVAQIKREGRSIAAYAVKRLRFIEDCNFTKNGALVQNKFLTDLINELGGEQYMNVVSTCERIWKALTEPQNVVLHLVGNLDVLKNPAAPLETFLPENLVPVQTKLNVTPDQLLLQPAKAQPMPGCVIGMGCLESSYLYQVVDCISDFEDPDLPALMLFLQYITQTEGAMFKLIRGKGFAYSYGLFTKPNEGLLYLILAKASNVVGAYHEAREIVQKQIDEKQWESNLVDSAKSSLIFELIEKEKTIGSVSWLSVVSYFEQVDYKYNRNLLNRINNVTIDDLNRVGGKYLPALFDPNKVKTAVVCVPSKAENIASTFKDSYGLNLSVYPSLEESFLK